MSSHFYEKLAAFLEAHKGEKEANELLTELRTDIIRGVRLVREYRLTANQQTKYEDTIKKTKDWTAFINRAGTLVHVMRDGAPHILIRLPGMKLKGTSDKWCVERISEALYEGF